MVALEYDEIFLTSTHVKVVVNRLRGATNYIQIEFRRAKNY